MWVYSWLSYSRAGFVGIQFVQSHGAQHSEGPYLLLKLLITLSLNSCLVCLTGKWSMHVNRGYKCIPHCLIHTENSQYRMNTEFQWAHSVQKFSETQGEYKYACHVYDWASRSADSPWRPHIPLGPGLGLKAENHWHSKKHEWWRNLIIFFLVHVISQQLALNMTQKEGEGQSNP